MFFPVVKRLFFFAVLLLLQPAQADDRQAKALDILVDMIHAMRTLDYQGTLVIYRNGKLDAMKLYHSVHNGVEQERLMALNSPMRVIVRQADKVVCVFLDSNDVIIDHRPAQRSFLFDFPDNLQELGKYYRFERGKKEKIAMLPAQLVSIIPRDDFRYGGIIWISLNNFLPLKYQLINTAGIPLEQVAFTELVLDGGMPQNDIQALMAQNTQRTRHIHRLTRLPFTEATFILENVPNGFHKEFFARRKMHNSEAYVEHMLLSDGLATVSVYMEKKDKELQSGFKTTGSTNFYTRDLDAYQVTVMGEVPAKTVKFIAEGVVLKKHEQ